MQSQTRIIELLAAAQCLVSSKQKIVYDVLYKCLEQTFTRLSWHWTVDKLIVQIFIIFNKLQQNVTESTRKQQSFRNAWILKEYCGIVRL